MLIKMMTGFWVWRPWQSYITPKSLCYIETSVLNLNLKQDRMQTRLWKDLPVVLVMLVISSQLRIMKPAMNITNHMRFTWKANWWSFREPTSCCVQILVSKVIVHPKKVCLLILNKKKKIKKNLTFEGMQN